VIADRPAAVLSGREYSCSCARRPRDRQEETTIVSRVDQARLDKFLAEQDLLRIEEPH
jgi:hypothetical protein